MYTLIKTAREWKKYSGKIPERYNVSDYAESAPPIEYPVLVFTSPSFGVNGLAIIHNYVYTRDAKLLYAADK